MGRGITVSTLVRLHEEAESRGWGTVEADRIEAPIAAMTLVEKNGQLTLGTADLVSGRARR